ncbi:GntR family transcriptional regulator, partial [Mycobacterium kansasii]
MTVETDQARADKRAAKIARRIEEDIVRRGWAVGESLGSEAALQQRYGVSRSVLREAVRLVEHH